MAATAEAARSAAGSLLETGQASAARVEQAAIVLGSALTYGYCPTGPAWAARLLAVEVLLADPEALDNDALEGDLYILRDNLRGTQSDA